MKHWQLKMTTKSLIVTITLVFIVGFALGRYSLPEKVKIVKEVVEVEKKDTKSDVNRQVDKDRHITTVTTQRRKSDGTTTTVTKVTEDDTSKSNTNKKTDISDLKITKTVESKEIDNSKNSVSLAVLAGFKFTNTMSQQGLETGPMCYGGIAQKRILGPISAGAWGLSCGQGGVSLGVQF